MKTPREILLEKHRKTDEKLDALRREVVAEHVIAPQFVKQREAAGVFDLANVAIKLWNELVVPCRGFWMGLACVWGAILIASFAMSASGSAPQMASAKPVPHSPEVMAALREQKVWINQMLGPIAQPTGDSATPGPRSERRIESVVG